MTYLGQTLARDPGRQPLQSFIKHLRFTHEAWREAEHPQGLRSVQAYRRGPEISVWGPRHPWVLLSQGILGAEILSSQGSEGNTYG